MSKQYDILLRLLIIGDSGVGKTCLLCRYVNDEFYPSYTATIGIDFRVKNMVISGKRIRVQVWDTAGQERFETITKQYYRRAQGVILCYDITNVTTFKHLNKWLNFLKQHASSKVDVTVVGNKTDLEEWRQVPVEFGQKFADESYFSFRETSAYAETCSVEEIFQDLIGRILLNQEDEINNQSIDSCPSDEEIGDMSRFGDKARAGKCPCSII